MDGYALSYGDVYAEEEMHAKTNKKGIWKGKFMRPELYRALNKSKKTRKKIKKRQRFLLTEQKTYVYCKQRFMFIKYKGEKNVCSN